jgi:hypothetical protein
MRVVVTGGRDYRGAEALVAVLNELRAANGLTLAVAQGGCPTGADYLARKWCEYWLKRGCLGVSLVTYEAAWREQGRGAGPMRNQRMLREFKPTLVVACPGGKGTLDCVTRAKDLGIPIRYVGSPISSES